MVRNRSVSVPLLERAGVCARIPQRQDGWSKRQAFHSGHINRGLGEYQWVQEYISEELINSYYSCHYLVVYIYLSVVTFNISHYFFRATYAFLDKQTRYYCSFYNLNCYSIQGRNFDLHPKSEERQRLVGVQNISSSPT